MRVSNTAIGLLLVLFASAVLVHVQGFPELENGYPGPALFPQVLSILFIVCGIGLAVQGIRNGERLLGIDLGAVTPAGWLNIACVLGAAVAYILLVEYVGFLILSFAILVALMWWFGVKLFPSLVASAGVTLAIFLLFAKILLVPLPWGLWGW